jgi:cytidylate kinase
MTRPEAGMIIAIDGPAASGKSTIARLVARHYGLTHLNTGALYRAVARAVMRSGARLQDEAAAEIAARSLDVATLADPSLQGRELGESASVVAAMPRVRHALFGFQRAFAEQARASGGAVIEGRDIGTVICPDAERKIYVTAAAEVRAERRRLECAARGESADFDAILAEIRRRDERDQSRADAPLARASDAYLLDTTNLDIDAALHEAVSFIGLASKSSASP